MPTKKSKAKSGKLGSFFSKLNPNSPKKKLLLFVVVFGLIAGGFYTYRSFAQKAGGAESVTRIRDLSPSGGSYTNYNGSSKLPTWTLANQQGNFNAPIMKKGTNWCIWGRVLGDSHGEVYFSLINQATGKTDYTRVLKFSLRGDKSRDQIIKCGGYSGGTASFGAKVKGIIEFTNLQYNLSGGK